MALLMRQRNLPECSIVEVITTESVQRSQAETVLISPSLSGVYSHFVLRGAWPTNILRLTMSLSRAKASFIIVGNLLLLNNIDIYAYLIETADKTQNLQCEEHIKAILKHDR